MLHILTSYVLRIVEASNQLRLRYAPQYQAHISYCAIFCQNDQQFRTLSDVARKVGKVVDETETGPVFIIPPIQTEIGPLRIVKIRLPDKTRPEMGDADFGLADYRIFKADNLEKPGFKLIVRENFEMMELVDSALNVRAYFSHPPVEEHPRIKKALEVDTESDAKTIWNYMFMHHELKPVEVIMVLGTNDTRVAEYAADLYKQNLAPYIVCSGGFGRVVTFSKPEAEVFRDILIAKGVPESVILVENKSTNTGENILFSMALLKEKGFDFKSLILAQRPFMERRMFATFKKHFPDIDCFVTSPPVSFEEYESDPVSKNLFINEMVGDLQRIKEYPAKGFQIAQDIPAPVWDAYEKLVGLGYTDFVLKN
jgi:uncharacterized SAM-binding protein YcdF (DUF218 family)